MELWIRSQDRESLLKVKKIELIYDCLCSDKPQLIHIDSDKGTLATYSTKERALEILDEIQDILKPQEYEVPTGRGTFTTSSNISNYVYQMPLE